MWHIVQLAISNKKLLGYLNGAVVPYGLSQSMLKEQSAGQQQALANPCLEAASLPCANLEQAKFCLRMILAGAASNQEQGPGQVALSNVKRMFRQQFELELSETALGHSKLTDLLQDPSFRDICYVQLEKHGYIVIQQQASHEISSVGFCADEPLCPPDAEQPTETVAFGPTPGPFEPTPLHASCGLTTVCDRRSFVPTTGLVSPAPSLCTQPVISNPAMPEDDSYLKQLLRDYLGQTQNTTTQETETSPSQFCLHEPLCLDAADQASHVPGFGPTPGPFGWTPSPQYTKTMVVPPLPSLSPWKGGLDGMVRKTFIHAQSPAKTPLPGSFRRSSSMGNLSETTRTTSARSASSESIDSNHDLVDSLGYLENEPVKISVPPTPMFWAPQTPFSSVSLEFSVPSAALPVLCLSDLLA